MARPAPTGKRVRRYAHHAFDCAACRAQGEQVCTITVVRRAPDCLCSPPRYVPAATYRRRGSMTNVIAMNRDQDYDDIRAEEIQRGDNIEFPSNHPDVKWHVEEGRASKPPCNQPGVLWYVEELVSSILGSPLGDLYKFTVKEVGAGAEVDVQIRGHVPVRSYRRNHG